MSLIKLFSLLNSSFRYNEVYFSYYFLPDPALATHIRVCCITLCLSLVPAGSLADWTKIFAVVWNFGILIWRYKFRGGRDLILNWKAQVCTLYLVAGNEPGNYSRTKTEATASEFQVEFGEWEKADYLPPILLFRSKEVSLRRCSGAHLLCLIRQYSLEFRPSELNNYYN